MSKCKIIFVNDYSDRPSCTKRKYLDIPYKKKQLERLNFEDLVKNFSNHITKKDLIDAIIKNYKRGINVPR